MSGPPSLPRDLGRLRSVARDLGELKRMRDQSIPDSVAERLFRLAWSRIAAGDPPHALWATTVADALVATRLGGIDGGLLHRLGLEAPAREAILRRGFDAATASLSPDVTGRLRDSLGTTPCGDAMPGLVAPGLVAPGLAVPGFVEALIRQPRAGATAPDQPRLALEPAESHGDHCLVVAVLGALVALQDGADPARVFLAGLAHHLHNAVLPDTGFAGELLLGDALAPIMHRLFEQELATLAPGPRGQVRDALALIADADTADGRAFHAADVIDRVLQAHHHARAAAFTADQALGDLQLVHEGPLRPFQAGVLAVLELA